MMIEQCVCGSYDLTTATSRIVGLARRRQYRCRTCGEYFATMELRVPPYTDVSTLQVRVFELLKKETGYGKAEAGQDEKSTAETGRLGGQHEASAGTEEQAA
jgi:hypothetical protein